MDSKKNYLLAKLCAYRERKTFLVHRLIAYSFYGGDFSLTVNHKNGVKTDNRVENLEIVTISENRTHAVKTGLWTPARGSQNGKASIDEDVVKMIRELRSDGLTYDQIAEKVQSSHKVVGDICRGRTWSHV
jgi:ribosome-binding protein aMBF1 (putative translation factor)